jgi:hypothetical protein
VRRPRSCGDARPDRAAARQARRLDDDFAEVDAGVTEIVEPSRVRQERHGSGSEDALKNIYAELTYRRLSVTRCPR